jgi:uncharacterized protein involved in propanediol utilization
LVMKAQSSSLTINQRPDGQVAGSAYACAHHGELIQGAFEWHDGSLRRALVSLPLRSKHAFATFKPDSQIGVRVQPTDRHKAARAAELALQKLNLNVHGGSLEIRSDIPIGHGYGSSSADVVAAVKAVFDAFGRTASATIASEIAVAAERASDAIAFEETSVLFAHRDGIVLEYLGGDLPPLALISFKSSDASPISTTALSRARYNADEIQAFRCALSAVRRAVLYQDPMLLGRAASLSARISQQHLAKNGFSRAQEVADRHGASGLQVSHSGSLFGIMMDASQPKLNARLSAIALDIQNAGFTDVEQLSISAEHNFDDR